MENKYTPQELAALYIEAKDKKSQLQIIADMIGSRSLLHVKDVLIEGGVPAKRFPHGLNDEPAEDSEGG